MARASGASRFRVEGRGGNVRYEVVVEEAVEVSVPSRATAENSRGRSREKARHGPMT